MFLFFKNGVSWGNKGLIKLYLCSIKKVFFFLFDKNSLRVFLNKCVGGMFCKRLVRDLIGVVVFVLMCMLSLMVKCIVCSMCIGFLW